MSHEIKMFPVPWVLQHSNTKHVNLDADVSLLDSLSRHATLETLTNTFHEYNTFMKRLEGGAREKWWEIMKSNIDFYASYRQVLSINVSEWGTGDREVDNCVRASSLRENDRFFFLFFFSVISPSMSLTLFLSLSHSLHLLFGRIFFLIFFNISLWVLYFIQSSWPFV